MTRLRPRARVAARGVAPAEVVDEPVEVLGGVTSASFEPKVDERFVRGRGGGSSWFDSDVPGFGRAEKPLIAASGSNGEAPLIA